MDEIDALLHCSRGLKDQAKLIHKATKMGLSAQAVHEENPHSVKIWGRTSLVKQFIQKYEGKKATVFTHNDKAVMRPQLLFDRQQSNLANKDLPGSGHTATSLAKYYSVPPQNGKAPTIGIISLGGTYKTSDLNYYWQTVEGLTTFPTVTYVNIGTTNAPNQPIVNGDGTDENTLDIEIAGSWCPDSKIVVYFGRNTTQGFYNAISYAINDTVNRPSIISISWGAPEIYYSASQLDAYDQLFRLACTKGITICVAAGDNGSDDGVGDNKLHCDFPATSPSVVSCGGTSLTTPESTWSWRRTTQSGTGGGISSHFKEPGYQLATVTYPTSTSPSIAKLKGNRAVPDMAFNADPATGWSIYFDGQLYVNAFGGTSCVAPALAGLLGRMNLRYSINFNRNMYALYANPSTRSCFKDITIGTNDSLTNSVGTFNARTGYDFVTGVGAINGTLLFNALKTIVPLHK
jgi:kumamolisin